MIQNMRDLGGIRTEDGRVIRTGMLVRSANLSQAEEKDLNGISAVIDLRTPGERKEVPDRLWGRQYLPMPLFDDVAAGITHEKETEEFLPWDMAMLYRLLMRECSIALRNVILTIMEHDFTSGAILWHCSEGKDRCGMTTALILEILGTDRKIILEDYLKTNLVNIPKAVKARDELMVSHGLEFADSVYKAYIADERYLRAAWDEMGPGYLQDRIQITPEMRESFREKILEG